VLWQAAPQLGDWGRVMRLLILTGQRCGEIGSLTWTEINREARQIELPKHRTKNRKAHIVPLSELAIEQLPAPREGYPHLFGRKRGGRGFNGFATGMQATRERVGGMPPWTPHDLRRTFVTLCNELDLAPPHIIEATVNHIGGAKASVAGVYNKAAWLPQRRALLEAWAERLAGMVGA
jgi:integrase